MPRLIQASDDNQLWGYTYDGDMSEVFQFQTEIAEQIARELDITLLEPARNSLRTKPTDNLEAYEYYLRGNYYYSRQIFKDDVEMAVKMYEHAIGLDSNFALAWAALSQAHIWLSWEFRQKDGRSKAKVAVDKALKLKPDLIEAHIALGTYYYYGSRDYDKALEQFEIVQRGQPSNAEAIGLIGFIRRRQGNWEQAVKYANESLKFNPRHQLSTFDLGKTYCRMHQYQEAELWLNRTISLDPRILEAYREKILLYISWDESKERAERVIQEASFIRTDPKGFLSEMPLMLIRIFPNLFEDVLEEFSSGTVSIDTIQYLLANAELYAQKNQDQIARAYFDSARVYQEARIQMGVHIQHSYSYLGLAYAGLGIKEEAIKHGKTAVEIMPVSKDALTGSYMLDRLTEIYIKVGEYEKAINQIEYLLSIPSRISVGILKLDPLYDPLHDNPRFQKLLEKYRQR
jgi:serine/threonine-protein kinase